MEILNLRKVNLFCSVKSQLQAVFYCMFLFILKTAVTEDDKDTNENESVSIPLLMRNALPDVEGFEKNEKLDIAMRPEEVSEETNLT